MNFIAVLPSLFRDFIDEQFDILSQGGYCRVQSDG
jgi:hypothetical protein